MAHITTSMVSLRKAQFGGIIYNHCIKDYLHHLWDVGIVGTSPRHLEVKMEAQAVVVRGKRPGARVCGIPQRPSEVISNILGCLLGVGEMGKEAPVHFLSLFSFSSAKKCMKFCGNYTTLYREGDRYSRGCNSRWEQPATPTSPFGSHNLKS